MPKTFRDMVAEGREGTPMLSPQEVQRRMKEEAGTLVVDVIDSRTHTLVWRGWARTGVDELLRDSRTMAKVIDRAVDEMLQQMPRGR